MKRVPVWVHIVSLLLFLISAVGCYYFMTRWHGNLQWAKAKEALNAKQEPLTFEELFNAEQFKRLPEAPDILASLVDESVAAQWAQRLEIDWPPEDLALLSPVVLREIRSEANKRLKAADGLLAATGEPLHWPIDYTEMPALPHLKVIHKLAILLDLTAKTSLHLGEPQAALQCLSEITALQRSIHPPVLLITLLVETSLRQMVLKTALEGLAMGQWKAEQIEAVLVLALDGDIHESIVSSLRGERIRFLKTASQMDESMLEQFNAWGGSSWKIEMLWLRYAPKGWLLEDKATMSLQLQKSIEMSMAPSPTIEPEPEFKHPATEIIFPVFSTIVQRTKVADKMRRLLIVACELQLDYMAHGRYPESLERLPSSAERRDQTIGWNFKYDRSDNHFRLSVPNLSAYRANEQKWLDWRIPRLSREGEE